MKIKDLPPEILRENILLNFEQRNLTTDGALIEVKDNDGNFKKDKFNNTLYKTPYLQAPFKGMEFKIFNSGIITIEGSLHKYWNNGAHNFNDFGINEIVEVINDLQDKFKITPSNCVLKQLEIGVNVIPPVKTKTVLKQCLLHKRERLKWVQTKDEGNYTQAQYQRYILKIYDKRTHYQNKGFQVDNEILRLEIKYRKMHELNARGIYTLMDLLNYGLENFTPELLKQWQQVIFYDFKALRGTKYFNTYSNPNFWENLTNDGLKYHRVNLTKIINKFPGNIKKYIANLIQEKSDLLNTSTPKSNTLCIGLKKGVSMPGKQDPNRLFCVVTGLNISMQKDSIMLSHTGLYYYYRTDKKIFEEVKRKHLSKKWIDADFKTQIKEIAHNIRDTRTNYLRKQRKLYPVMQQRLFAIEQQSI